VVLPFGSAHAPPPSAKRSDAAKVAQLEAALGSSRSDAGCRAAAAAAYAPGVAYWFDAQPDWGNVSYQGADRGAAPRFTRFRSTLLAAREGGEGGAPAGLGRRRGYPGAGLDSAPTDPTAGATQGRAAAAAAAAAAASQRSCCAALPPSRLRRLLPQPSLAAEACTSAPAPAERLRVPDPDAADAAQSSEAHAQRLGAQLQCAARERPYDVAVWLRLAAFQEEQLRSAAAAAASRSRRAEAQQRRVLTLEQALGHHPGSESLTLMLLRACAQAGDAQPEMDARWEAALAEAPGGGRLWTAAVARAAAHSPLSAAVLAQRAVEALTRERARRAEGGAACAELDAALCDVALAAVAADVHAGWEERGLAKLQAVVEFACFGPSWDEDEMGEAKQRNRRTQGRGDAAAQRLRAFLRFWASEAPRWGETGAKGWAAWCAEQQLGGYEPAAPLPPPLPPPPPPPPAHVPPDEDVPAGGAIAQEGDEQEDGEQRDGGEAADAADEEESDEALLCRLGITLDAEVLTSSMSGEALCEWLQEEAARDAQGWRPLRAADVRSRSDAALLVDAAEVQEGGLLFELGSEEARAELLLKALALLGSCDDGDCASPRELLMAHLPRCGSAAAWRAGEGGRGGWTAEAAVQAALRFPRHPRMCTAALQAHSGTGEAREAAKRLLAAKRGSLPLWAAFAGHEAAAGRVAHARKAFHGALALAQQAAAAQAQQASVLSAALEGGGGGAAAGTDGACGAAPALADVPALVLRYAEFEAAHGACEAARDALARLGCCFCGGGTSLLPGEGAPPSELHAQRGFQAALCAVAAQPAEALPGACALWVLFAAALYAELTDRPQAAASMLVRAAPASPQAHARALGTLLGPRAACAPPRLASEAFASALRLFPASPQVLALLASAPARAKLSSHALRRMADGASAAGGGEQALWAALALEAAFCSDGGGGGGAHSPPLASPRARALLSRAAMSPELAALPLLWRCRLLAASSAAGGPAAATRRAFFRAAAAAPACKALWLQGLGACNARDGALSDAERAQLLDAAQREGRLRLRADAYELALQRQARGLLDQ